MHEESREGKEGEEKDRRLAEELRRGLDHENAYTTPGRQVQLL